MQAIASATPAGERGHEIQQLVGGLACTLGDARVERHNTCHCTCTSDKPEKSKSCFDACSLLQCSSGRRDLTSHWETAWCLSTHTGTEMGPVPSSPDRRKDLTQRDTGRSKVAGIAYTSCGGRKGGREEGVWVVVVHTVCLGDVCECPNTHPHASNWDPASGS